MMESESELDPVRPPNQRALHESALELPPAELRRLAEADPFAIVDLNVRDARSGRLFAGTDRGIDALMLSHPPRAALLTAEGVALRADPVWLDRESTNVIHEEWRAALATLTPDNVRHLALRAETSENSFISARYAHVAWRMDRAMVDTGRLAVRSYLVLASAHFAAADGHAGCEALDRASQIAAVIRDSGLMGEVLAGVEAAADELEAAYGYRWLLELTEPAQRIARRLGQDVLVQFVPRIERAVEFLASEAPADYPERRRFTPNHTGPTPLLADRAIAQLTDLRRAAGQRDATRSGARRRGWLWEAHAEALRAQEEPRIAALVVRHHFGTAERWYREAGDREAADRTRMAVEDLRDRAAAEMSRHTASTPIEREDLDAALRPIVDAPDIDTALARLAQIDGFLPRWSEAQPYRAPQTLGDKIMPPVNFDAALNRATADDAVADARESNYYGIALQVSQFFIGNLFWQLRDHHSFTAAAVLRCVNGWPLIDADRAAFIESAVFAYFREDYVAFFRTIMPEFESLVRHVTGVLGRPTTAPHRRLRGVDEERGLDDLLSREPALIEALGVDLWYNLQQLLVKKSGLQLRHADAHALLPRDFYTEGWANVLLVLLVRLTRVRLPSA